MTDTYPTLKKPRKPNDNWVYIIVAFGIALALAIVLFISLQ